jgi:predicted transcriptional regulator
MTPQNAEIGAAITEHYIETEKGMTVAEIAVKMGWTESKVRAHIRNPAGFPPDGIKSEAEYRPSFSKNYKGRESGGHKVEVYYPTIGRVREMLIAARASK